MRKRLTVLVTMGVLASLAFSGPEQAIGDAGSHVYAIRGLSTVLKQCQYQWKTTTPNAVTGDNAVRDDLGIPQPQFNAAGAPQCLRDANGNEIVGNCTLKRNLGTYPSNNQTGTPWDQLRGSLNRPCSGVLTAETNQYDNEVPGGYGACVDLGTNSSTHCRLNAPTWFYGYCAQTYGGDTLQDGVGTPGFFEINNIRWTLDALGFPRGRGVWEFGAKLSRRNAQNQVIDTTTARFYLDAVPNKLPQEATACDGGPNITSVMWFGTIIIPAPPIKTFRTKPGWHPCADDPGFNTRLNPAVPSSEDLQRMIPGNTNPPPVYSPQGC